jgi:hypothetical protein
MALCYGQRRALAVLLFVAPTITACSGGLTKTQQGGGATARHDCPSASGRFTDATIVKTGPFASGYEVRGPRKGNFLPPNTIITTAGNHLLVRGYGEVFAYRLTGVRVRRMSSLIWVEAKGFPAERNGAILRAYRDSIRSGMAAVARKSCADCYAVFSDPAPPSTPPFPQPPMPSLREALVCPAASIRAARTRQDAGLAA